MSKNQLSYQSFDEAQMSEMSAKLETQEYLNTYMAQDYALAKQ